jgi:hypothetical protein
MLLELVEAVCPEPPMVGQPVVEFGQWLWLNVVHPALGNGLGPYDARLPKHP